jgi:hypothetical protein
MKSKVSKAIKEIYSLFKKPPKLNVKNVKQHIHDLKDRPEHYKTVEWTAFTFVTPLRAAINYVQSKKKCAFCVKSAEDVQSSLINDWYKEEYQISALCGDCQDQTFVSSPDDRPQEILNVSEVPY